MAQINNVLGIEVKKRLQDISDIKKESGQSLARSRTAEEISQIAKQLSEMTQEELTQAILAAGDSAEERSAEVGSARVDAEGNAYRKLKDRLDDKENHFDNKITGLHSDLGENPSINKTVWSEFIGREINVEWFGAVGDGSTDDTQAWEAAKEFIQLNGGIFFVPANLNCYIPHGIDLFGLSNIKIEGRISGDSEKTLTIGIRSQVALPFRAYLNRVNSLTVQVQGIKNGNVTINYADHLLLWADGASENIKSLSYSNFYLGYVDRLEINSKEASSWINENKFFGGRISDLLIDGVYNHNHNHFYSPTLENSTININVGSSNHIINCRLEGENDIFFGERSWSNTITRSWDSAPGSNLAGQSRYRSTDLGRGNMVSNIKDAYTKRQVVFEINSTSQNYNLNNIVKTSNGLLNVVFEGRYKNVLETGLIPINDDFGIELDSDASNWRMYVEAFDHQGRKIVTEPIGLISSGELKWTGSAARYQVDISTNHINASVFKKSDVKFIKVLVSPHNWERFSFLTITLGQHVGTPIVFPILNKHQKPTINKVPAEGYWGAGDYADYLNPQPEGYKGLVCTASGTPGTWKEYGDIH